MQRSWVDSPLYTLSDWVMRLAYLNLIWLLFTVVGLVVFGFMPATVAMFTVVRKLLQKEANVPIFKAFICAYKESFFRANLVGLFLILFGYVLLINFTYLGTLVGTTHTLLSFGLIFVSLFYLATILLIFPVMVHFKLPLTQYVKQCLFIAFINPHLIIFMGAGIIGFYYIFQFIPGLTLFFIGSVIAVFLMWVTLIACDRIEKKRQSLIEQVN